MDICDFLAMSETNLSSAGECFACQNKISSREPRLKEGKAYE